MEVLLALLMAMATGVIASGVFAVVVLLLSGSARGATHPAGDEQALLGVEEVSSGRLLFKTPLAGRYRAAPIVSTQVHMRVTGMLARVRVEQRFSNPTEKWLEGIYVFPLPQSAAVDYLRMHIGERVIEGQIRERERARRIYTAAKTSGRKAALVEQQRPNIFTTALANIAPGESVRVEIRYQQVVRYDQGRFRLRFPLVVAPRYIPGQPQGEADYHRFNSSGWARDTDQVPDASRITPPVSIGAQPVPEVALSVDLRPGMALADVRSSYHRVHITRAEQRYRITLDAGAVPADRDFELVWEPRAQDAPRAALFTETREDAAYVLMMLMPPDPAHAPARRLPREVIYVIDTSGSMAGASLRQARAALQLCCR
jgi:Ca-activated chloride channel family protein